MQLYQIRLTTAVGHARAHIGLFPNAIQAVIHTLSHWPMARAVSAKRLHPTTHPNRSTAGAA